MSDKDFSRVHFKVNVSGSWSSLCNCSAEQFEEVKAACDVLVKHHNGRIRFKALDADGGVIEQYSPTGSNGASRWHEPS